MPWALATLLVLSTLALAPTAQAQPTATQRERFATLCLACHGERGVSTTPLTPSLAGQHAFYATTQLFLFRVGRRDNAAMTEVGKAMTDADLLGYAELIAQLPKPPAPAAVPDAARMARGAVLAQRLHCIGCHGADGAGERQVPRIAHQREDYLLHALQGFRNASRVGYGPAMSEALAGTSPKDLEDLAHFMAHWPNSPPAR